MQLNLWQNKLDKDIEEFRSRLQQIKLEERSRPQPTSSWVGQCTTWLRNKIIPHSHLLFQGQVCLRDILQLDLGKLAAPTVDTIRQNLESATMAAAEILSKQNRGKGESDPMAFMSKVSYDIILQELVSKDIRILAWLGSLIAVVEVLLTYACFITLDQDPTAISASLYSLIIALLLLASFYLKSVVAEKESYVQLKQRMGLKILLYDRLLVFDSKFLEITDANVIHKLFAVEFADYTAAILLQWRPMIIVCIAIFGTAIFTVGNLLLAGAMYLLVYALIILLLYYLKVPLIADLKRASIRKQRLVSEILHNYKHIRSSGLSQYYTEKMLESADVIEKIKKKTSRLVVLDTFFTRLATPMIALLLHVWLMVGIKPKLQKDWDNIILPPALLGLVFNTYAFSYFLDGLKVSIEQETKKKSAKVLFDKFFNSDVTVEPDQVRCSPLPPGSLLLRDCDFFDRTPHNFTEVIDFIVANEHSDSRPSFRSPTLPTVVPKKSVVVVAADVPNKSTVSRQLWPVDGAESQESLRQTERVVEAASPDREVSAPVDGESRPVDAKDAPVDANSPVGSDAPIDKKEGPPRQVAAKLRHIFAQLDLHVAPATKLCVVEHKHRPLAASLFRALLGGGIVTRGSVERSGRVLHLSLARPGFLVGASLRQNVLFGSAFDSQRYEAAVKAVGLSFASYLGRDFFEVAENADNLRSEDRLLVLLARAVYQDADVYLLEDFLNDSQHLASVRLVEDLFRGPLRLKTVVYNSRQLPFVRLATVVGKFSVDHRLKCLPIETVRDEYRRSYGLSLDDPRLGGSHSKRKSRHCFLVLDADFREELAVEADLQKRRRFIESVKRLHPNGVDRMLFGMVLLARRVTAGKTLAEPEEKRESLLQVFGAICNRGRKDGWNRIAVYAIMSLIMHLGFFFTIFVIAYSAYFQSSSIPTRTFLKESSISASGFKTDYGLDIGRSHMIVVVTIVGQCVITYITAWYAKWIGDQYNQFSERQINRQLFFLDYGFTGKNFFHLLVNRLTSDRDAVYLELLPKYISLIDSLAEAVCLTIACTVVLSIWPALIIEGALWWFFARIVYPSLTGLSNMQVIRDRYAEKLSALNYQQLPLLSEIRTNYSLSMLKSKLESLTNIYARVQVVHNLVLRRGTTLIMIVVICFILVSASCARAILILIPSAVYLDNKSAISRLMILIWVRHVQVVLEVIKFYQLLSESKAQLSSLVEFERNLDAQQEIKQFSALYPWEMRNFGEDSPIVFRQVSLTIGYRPILKNVSFSIARREKVALAGAETFSRFAIFEMIMGMRVPDGSRRLDVGSRHFGSFQPRKNHAKIKIFGVERELIDSDHYQQIMMIDEVPKLLEGSIRCNIDPYEKHSDERILEVAILFDLSNLYNRFYSEADVIVFSPQQAPRTKQKERTPKNDLVDKNQLLALPLAATTKDGYIKANSIEPSNLKSNSENAISHQELPVLGSRGNSKVSGVGTQDANEVAANQLQMNSSNQLALQRMISGGSDFFGQGSAKDDATKKVAQSRFLQISQPGKEIISPLKLQLMQKFYDNRLNPSQRGSDSEKKYQKSTSSKFDRRVGSVNRFDEYLDRPKPQEPQSIRAAHSRKAYGTNPFSEIANQVAARSGSAFRNSSDHQTAFGVSINSSGDKMKNQNSDGIQQTLKTIKSFKNQNEKRRSGVEEDCFSYSDQMEDLPNLSKISESDLPVKVSMPGLRESELPKQILVVEMNKQDNPTSKQPGAGDSKDSGPVSGGTKRKLNRQATSKRSHHGFGQSFNSNSVAYSTGKTEDFDRDSHLTSIFEDSDDEDISMQEPDEM